ncbi:MAG: ATP synthase F1 subunit epsilon [Pirellulales bacterium]
MADSSHENPSSLRIVVVTPEATVRDEAADFVALPLYDGEIGIAPLHSPMIGRLGYGEMRIKHGQHEDRFYVDGGFAEVIDNVVSVLTNRAIPANELDAESAAVQLTTAQARPANTPELMAIRDRIVSQTRAQIRVARHDKGSGSHGH